MITLQFVIGLILILFILIILFSMLVVNFSLAPFVPTRKKDINRMLSLANLQAGEKFYDLGCGIGGVVLAVAKNRAVSATGIELAWPLYLICRFRQLLNGGKNINFKNKNLFKADLSQADVIYVFGMPEAINRRLKQKLEAEAKAGVRVISYAFAIKDWEPVKVDKPDKNSLTLYLYQR